MGDLETRRHHPQRTVLTAALIQKLIEEGPRAGSDQLDSAQHATDHSSGDETGTDETQINDNAHNSDGKTDPLDQTRGRSSPHTP